MSDGRRLSETLAGLLGVGLDLDAGDARQFRPMVADADHIIDLVGRAGEHRFDIAVAPVAHPAVEAAGLRLLRGPGTEPDTLDGAGDQHVNGLAVGHGYANSTITWSTERLSPALACSFATLPSRSARSMFSIFIASTTASSCPALMSWPSFTEICTSNPGIGDSRYFDMSGGVFSSMWPASAAARGASTWTFSCAPPCAIR